MHTCPIFDARRLIQWMLTGSSGDLVETLWHTVDFASLTQLKIWYDQEHRRRSLLSRFFFSRLSHISDLKIGTPVATLTQASGDKGSALELVGPVSAYCGWVRESLICNFYLSVATHNIVWADTSLRYAGMLHVADQKWDDVIYSKWEGTLILSTIVSEAVILTCWSSERNRFWGKCT